MFSRKLIHEELTIGRKGFSYMNETHAILGYLQVLKMALNTTSGLDYSHNNNNKELPKNFAAHVDLERARPVTFMNDRGLKWNLKEMFTLWIVLTILMADVMPRGHGGDGDDDPTPPGGYRRGVHQEDVEPPRRKTRGKAKNINLMKAVSTNKGPLEVSFDTEATFTLVGERNDWFTRDIGIYLQANIAFDKKSWDNVSEYEKNALYEHLRESFDLDAVERDLEAAKKKGGIEAAIKKRYRDRKARAKQHFLRVGGEADLERAWANPPEDMPEQNWWRAIEFFMSEPHKSPSRVNTSVRQFQKYTNRGGTSSYSSFCYKGE